MVVNADLESATGTDNVWDSSITTPPHTHTQTDGTKEPLMGSFTFIVLVKPSESQNKTKMKTWKWNEDLVGRRMELWEVDKRG